MKYLYQAYIPYFICLMVRSSIDSRESLVLIGLSWAWASLVILPSGRIELVASAFPLSESLRGVTNPISQSVGQMHWHWRIRFLLFQKTFVTLPCCWVCPSFFSSRGVASLFLHPPLEFKVAESPMMTVSVLDSVELPGRALQLLQARFVLLESLGKRKRSSVERIRVFLIF